MLLGIRILTNLSNNLTFLIKYLAYFTRHHGEPANSPSLLILRKLKWVRFHLDNQSSWNYGHTLSGLWKSTQGTFLLKKDDPKRRRKLVTNMYESVYLTERLLGDATRCACFCYDVWFRSHSYIVKYGIWMNRIKGKVSSFSIQPNDRYRKLNTSNVKAASTIRAKFCFDLNMRRIR